jgi:hypothetical protein
VRVTVDQLDKLAIPGNGWYDTGEPFDVPRRYRATHQQPGAGSPQDGRVPPTDTGALPRLAADQTCQPGDEDMPASHEQPPSPLPADTPPPAGGFARWLRTLLHTDAADERQL